MKPRGAWSLYAAQIVGVGFHSSQGEGAPSWEAAAMKISPQITQIDTDYKKNKKISVICVICGHLFFIVSGRGSHYVELP